MPSWCVCKYLCSITEDVLHLEFLIPAHHVVVPWGNGHNPSYKHGLTNKDSIDVHMYGIPALDSTSLLLTFSCHLIPRIPRRHIKWKRCSLCSCLEYRVKDLLPYRRVLKIQALYTSNVVDVINCLLSHTHLVSLESVVTALLIKYAN